MSDLVTSVLRDYDDQVVGHLDLLPGVRRRRRTIVARRWAALVAVALVVGVGAVRPWSQGPPAPVDASTPDGWVVGGTMGFEAAVPPGWKRLETDESWDGRMDREPYPAGRAKLTEGGPYLPDDIGYRSRHERRVRVAGIDAFRVGERLPDGRYLGWLRVPSRNVAMSVVAPDAGEVERVLDTLHPVQTDSAGCPASRLSAPAAPEGAPAAAFADPHPESISVCQYSTPVESSPGLIVMDPRLDATVRVTTGDQVMIKRSVRLTGARAAEMARAFNAADRPAAKCTGVPDALVLVKGATGTTATVYVHLRDRGSCATYVFDNGRRQIALDLPELLALSFF